VDQQLFLTAKDCIGFSYVVWSCDGYTLTCILCALALSLDLCTCVCVSDFWVKLHITYTEDVHLHTPAVRIGTHFLLTLETVGLVFLFHLLSATSKPFSSLSTRLAHAARLGFFYKKTRYINSLLLLLLSASLYVSKRGAYWDRLCRDVVGCWLVSRWLVGRWLVGWLVVGCHARALWPNGAS